VISKIEINNCVYTIHPVYDLYATDEDGNILYIVKQIPSSGNLKKDGYLACMARKHGQKGQESYLVHRFVWECYNGLIPDDKVIDHITDDKKDNRLCNLQLMTQQQNCKKSAEKPDYSFAKYNHQNRKYVKAINQQTKEVTYYRSLYATQQNLQINGGIIKMICEKLNNYKTGVSKKEGYHYKFEYVNKEHITNDCKSSLPGMLSEYQKKRQIEK